MGQHNALGEARGIVILGAAILVANIHQAPRRARRDQAFVDEAAHGVDVDIAVSRIVLDMRRIGKQDQLHVYAPFSSPTSELLDVLMTDFRYVRFIRCKRIDFKWFIMASE